MNEVKTFLKKNGSARNMAGAVAVIIALALIGWSIFFIEPHGGQGDNNNRGGENIALVVNGEEIPSSSFEKLRQRIAREQGVDLALLETQEKNEFEDQVMESLIYQTLLKQATAQSDITVADSEIDAQIEMIKGQFESEESYKKALAEEGLSPEELRESIRVEVSLERYLEQKLKLSSVTVTEKEVVAAYEQIAAVEGDIPPLKDVHEQIESLAVQQKQQQLVSKLIEELRGEAQIQILI